MKTLSDYINTIKHTYNYRIKFAFEPDDDQLQVLESILQKYNMYNISSIYKSPIQKNPLDFPTIDAAEIFMIDIETEVPMSPEAFRQQFQNATKTSADLIHVRNDSSPYNAYEQQIIDFQEKPYVVKLSDSDYESDGVESQELYGDEYNKKLVQSMLDDKIAAPKKKTQVLDAVKEYKSKSMLGDIKNSE